MANPEHVANIREGVVAWNTWRKSSDDLRTDLSRANLIGAILSEANLFEANLIGADLYGANLSRTDLSQADLTGANLSVANLIGADLRGANLFGADLSHANLSQAVLSEADLSLANLSGADLREADLSQVNLGRAADTSGPTDLRGANLSGASLRHANLIHADLRGADLFGASLSHTNLIHADLRGADFDNARAVSTVFGDVDLSEVKGIEAVQHAGPSTIGVDTLLRSGGLIPEEFLRGCGLRDWEIESAKLYRRGLTATEINEVVYRVFELRAGQPLQYHSCFISYASEDETFANRLYDDLQGRGVRCWFAPHHMRAGRKIHDQITEAIQFHDKLLLILSPASIMSEWVKEEILNAWAREKRESRKMLFPVSLVNFDELRGWKCFDADTGRDIAREIREYFIPKFTDFSNPTVYGEAFKKLVASLAASKPAASGIG